VPRLEDRIAAEREHATSCAAFRGLHQCTLTSTTCVSIPPCGLHRSSSLAVRGVKSVGRHGGVPEGDTGVEGDAWRENVPVQTVLADNRDW